jgi:hypothetical protein
MKSAIKLNDSDVAKASKAATEAKKSTSETLAARAFSDLSSEEKDELLKELAIRAGLVGS